MAETPTIPSEGEWRYSFKCRDCGLRFSRRPTHLPVGPLLETRRGILADDTGIIPLYEEVRVYTGSVLDLQCPDCLLRPFFPVRISEALWEKWCSEQATTIESDSILRAYVALARRYDDATVGYTPEAVVACFRCNGQLRSGRLRRRCPDCGETDRINLVGSQYTGRGYQVPFDRLPNGED